MKHTKAVAALALCGLVFGAYGWGHAQGQGDAVPTMKEIAYTRSDANNPDKPLSTLKLTELYQKVYLNPEALKQVGYVALLDAQHSGNTDVMVVQMMQNQRLIEQNDRIIALLEAQAKQKGK